MREYLTRISMDWINFEPGEEPSVLTTDLCGVYGCDACPGYVRVRDLPGGRMRSGEAPPNPDATVLCIHSCHRISDEELEERESRGPDITVSCPRCGHMNTLPGGFMQIEIFECQQCGQMVKVAEGPVQ